MPFENIGGKNFEEVLLGLQKFFEPVHFLLRYHPPVNGWTFDQHIAALSQMIGDASDKLYQSDADHGDMIKELQAKSDDLRKDHDGLALIVSRLQEQLQALQSQ